MVSIIVPVYNCAEHLEKCVGSILAQTHRELELILVDDGSTDGSGALCDALAAGDPRVRVLHQANGGVSAARNAGLEAARGGWIGFVDADDWIDPQTYATALAAGEDCEIVMWDAATVWDGGRTEPDTIPLLPESRVLERSDWSPELLALMAGAVWRCLYRRELIEGIFFPLGIKLSEDRLFNLAAMGKAQRLRYLKTPLYFRYVRPGSAVNRYHGDKFEKNLLALKNAEETIEKYWDESYLGVYTKMFAVGGALDAVYEICSPQFPGKRRLAAIRAITNNETLRAALARYGAVGLRENFLKYRLNAALLAVGCAYNWKHR